MAFVFVSTSSQEPELESIKHQKLRVLTKVVFYKAKGFVTAILLKQMFKIFFTLETLTWLAPHAPGMSACFWCDLDSNVGLFLPHCSVSCLIALS